jgi:hypothetical protein
MPSFRVLRIWYWMLDVRAFQEHDGIDCKQGLRWHWGRRDGDVRDHIRSNIHSAHLTYNIG